MAAAHVHAPVDIINRWLLYSATGWADDDDIALPTRLFSLILRRRPTRPVGCETAAELICIQCAVSVQYVSTECLVAGDTEPCRRRGVHRRSVADVPCAVSCCRLPSLSSRRRRLHCKWIRDAPRSTALVSSVQRRPGRDPTNERQRREWGCLTRRRTCPSRPACMPFFGRRSRRWCVDTYRPRRSAGQGRTRYLVDYCISRSYQDYRAYLHPSPLSILLFPAPWKMARSVGRTSFAHVWCDALTADVVQLTSEEVDIVRSSDHNYYRSHL